MSKTIKLENRIYEELRRLQNPRETYSQVIGRLLTVYYALYSVSETLGPSHHLKENPLTDARAKETIDYGGRTAKLPYKDK